MWMTMNTFFPKDLNAFWKVCFKKIWAKRSEVALISHHFLSIPTSVVVEALFLLDRKLPFSLILFPLVLLFVVVSGIVVGYLCISDWVVCAFSISGKASKQAGGRS
ncbi:hypothetical protein EJ08DRAFT_196593 [Tothia fuscella]|uniref:Uncharacterized protein n=1 Tax=Tothia fuscella TaxID=1048955 RepID=A0A9P4TYT6_9PEZI|nr:hypothetical protein EJ08DRAFT_196593 [Tothia fuscella]